MTDKNIKIVSHQMKLYDSKEKDSARVWATIYQIPQIVKDEVIRFMKLGYGWLGIVARTGLTEDEIKEIIHEYEVFKGTIKDH